MSGKITRRQAIQVGAALGASSLLSPPVLTFAQGETPISYRSSSHTEVVHGDGDVVTFTTSMDVSGENVTFTVANGNSQTWGTFSQSGWLNRTASCN